MIKHIRTVKWTRDDESGVQHGPHSMDIWTSFSSTRWQFDKVQIVVGDQSEWAGVVTSLKLLMVSVDIGSTMPCPAINVIFPPRYWRNAKQHVGQLYTITIYDAGKSGAHTFAHENVLFNHVRYICDQKIGSFPSRGIAQGVGRYSHVRRFYSKSGS